MIRHPEAVSLDAAWLRCHPLPVHADGTDKNDRGRVLVAGGSMLVPGALRLTAEAALRAGAGKVQIATVAEAVVALGVLIPEAAVIALPAGEEGELSVAAAERLAKALGRCDTLVFGPGMGDREAAADILRELLAPREGLSLVLDAAAVACARDLDRLVREHGGRVVLTPHYGEAAQLTGRDEAEIEADPAAVAREAAARFGAVMVLKSSETVIAAPDGTLLHYAGGGVGLATGGSGDVLAGIVGGLLSRGAEPLVAAAWGVWLHGQAGHQAALRIAPIGFLGRDLPGEVPRLMASL